MKTCTYCGAQIPDTARFCTSCRRGIPQSAQMQQPYGQPRQPQALPAQQMPVQHTTAQMPAQAPAQTPQSQASATKNTSSRSAGKAWPHMRTRIKRLIMLSIRLAFLAFTICIFITMKTNSDGRRKTGDMLSPEAAALLSDIEDNENSDLSVMQSLKIYFKATSVEIKAKGVSHYFSGKILYQFWWFLMTMGIICFAWNDLRMAAKFGHMSGVEADKTTFYWDVFVNGAYSHSYKSQGSYVLAFPIVALFTFIVLAIIFPIRFFINILMDIVGIISGSEKMGNFSVIGNVVASIALYAIIISLLSGPKDNIVTLIVAGIIFIAACIINRLNLF